MVSSSVNSHCPSYRTTSSLPNRSAGPNQSVPVYPSAVYLPNGRVTSLYDFPFSEEPPHQIEPQYDPEPV